MAILYQVAIENKRTKDSRTFSILTDTIQSALSIAKASCKNSDEEITYLYLDSRDPIIDYQVIDKERQG